MTQFKTSPPATSFSKLSFPAEHILLITLSRPKSLNCINSQGHQELDAVYTWFDHEPSMRVAIVTGEGRAFCAGADLKEWNNSNTSGVSRRTSPFPASGFGGLSTRSGLKPVICAVNGIAFGGGFEMIINADIVIADASAQLGLPEVKRGVVALDEGVSNYGISAGALPRLTRVVGRQRATEMCLTGRAYSAQQMKEWGVINAVVKGNVVAEAVNWAIEIASNSPDAVIISRIGVLCGWDGISAQAGTEKVMQEWYPKIDRGENMVEGVRAFVEKRKPIWVDSKL